ncbi:MAG: hypothetical protein J5674_01415 [Candidatus Methanomethylophilaceae archaeon]|nr:hypothetical protein [Candidatus Methanomethylophilaceae archaeon]
MMGMPLKLMVSFLLIGLMLPAITGMVSTVEESSDDVGADPSCAAVEECIYRVFRAGSGSVETVHVGLGPEDAIVLGGEGADAHSIRLYRNGELRRTVFLDEAPVVLSGTEAVIVGGDVTFECVAVDRGLVVGVAGRSSSPSRGPPSASAGSSSSPRSPGSWGPTRTPRRPGWRTPSRKT